MGKENKDCSLNPKRRDRVVEWWVVLYLLNERLSLARLLWFSRIWCGEFHEENMEVRKSKSFGWVLMWRGLATEQFLFNEQIQNGFSDLTSESWWNWLAMVRGEKKKSRSSVQVLVCCYCRTCTKKECENLFLLFCTPIFWKTSRCLNYFLWWELYCVLVEEESNYLWRHHSQVFVYLGMNETECLRCFFVKIRAKNFVELWKSLKGRVRFDVKVKILNSIFGFWLLLFRSHDPKFWWENWKKE